MAKTVYLKTALVGGTADSLDGIDGANLLDGDVAYVYESGIRYDYILDADSGLAESSPSVIAPDVNAGDKRWILQSARFASLEGTPIGQTTPAAAAFTNFQRGTGTFNGPNGVTVSIDDIGTTDYQVAIQPLSQSGFIGEISVESKAANSFVVKNSGSDTTTQFDWILNAAIA